MWWREKEEGFVEHFRELVRGLEEGAFEHIDSR